VEEKYGQASNPNKRKSGAMDAEDEGLASGSDDSSSTDEDEDDEGILATTQLDDEISATLQAIKSKDPRVYQTDVTFYSKFDEDQIGQEDPKKEKPMYLRDYHRKQLLEGQTLINQEEDALPIQTYDQEQDELQKAVIRSMYAAATSDSSADGEKEDGDSDSERDFLVPKKKSNAIKESIDSIEPAQKKRRVEVDVAEADKNPETFLSNFMAARAWVPDNTSRFQPLESDDDEEDEKADTFETAYNLRFEDPKASNEKLVSHARNMAAKLSVRREETTGRRKARDGQKSKKELEKEEREEEKARLRKLRIEETEEKIKKIQAAAGLRGGTINESDWSRFLDEGWDDDRWEQEMNERFGESYYQEGENDIGDQQAQGPKKNKIKKPKWDDDIDITDLVPEYADEEKAKPQFTPSDEEEMSEDEGVNGLANGTSKKKRDHKKERQDQKREARKQRRKVEDFVDERLDFDVAFSRSSSSKQPTRFHYRETSPVTYGLTSRDILSASDTQLNQYAGLKKLAAFRDESKKRKDRKNLGKKARLRQWRKDIFGDESGPALETLNASIQTQPAGGGTSGGEGIVSEDQPKGKKRRRRVRQTSGSCLLDL
jgi:protein KRI1